MVDKYLDYETEQALVEVYGARLVSKAPEFFTVRGKMAKCGYCYTYIHLADAVVDADAGIGFHSWCAERGAEALRLLHEVEVADLDTEFLLDIKEGRPSKQDIAMAKVDLFPSVFDGEGNLVRQFCTSFCARQLADSFGTKVKYLPKGIVR